MVILSFRIHKRRQTRARGKNVARELVIPVVELLRSRHQEVAVNSPRLQ